MNPYITSANTFHPTYTIPDIIAFRDSRSCTDMVECLSDAHCDDGLFCNGVEFCDGNTCKTGTSTPCEGQLCDEEKDNCVDGSCGEINDKASCSNLEPSCFWGNSDCTSPQKGKPRNGNCCIGPPPDDGGGGGGGCYSKGYSPCDSSTDCCNGCNLNSGKCW